MLDQALDALKAYDWGSDLKPLAPIDQAINQSHGDAAARQPIEDRLRSLLGEDISHAARDLICRKLRTIGTAASVPVLASMLADPKLSHMARYALEAMPCAEAGSALRDSLTKLSTPLKVGAISSLGVRQDADSVNMLAKLAATSSDSVARAAIQSLGAIRSAHAAKALTDAQPTSAAAKQAKADALLACAESILAAGDKISALKIYKSFVASTQPKHIKLAATRGMLACAGK